MNPSVASQTLSTLGINEDQRLILQRLCRRLGESCIRDLDYDDDPEQVDELVARGWVLLEQRRANDGWHSGLEWIAKLTDAGWHIVRALQLAGLCWQRSNHA